MRSLGKACFLAIALFVLPYLLLETAAPVLAGETPLAPASAPVISSVTENATGPAEIQFFGEIRRKGEFLKDPGAEKLELFRRIGRNLSSKFTLFENNVLSFGAFRPAGAVQNPASNPIVLGRDFTNLQKEAAEAFSKRSAPLTDELTQEIPEPSSGFFFKGSLDPKSFTGMLLDFADKAEKGKLSPTHQNKITRVREEIVPFLKNMDLVGMVGRLTGEGLSFRLDIRGNLELPEPVLKLSQSKTPIALAQYVDPDSLFVFGQYQEVPDPKVIMEELKKFPQTLIIENYLASAGLNLEKDILPTGAEETLAIVNLDPIGEGGIPDIRLMEKVRDPLKLMAMVPQLKQLAMNLGIFVQPNLETVPTARISYFLAPTVAFHIGMVGDILLISSNRQKLLGMAQRIADVQSKKVPEYTVPEGTSRFWKIRFRLLNEQLQKLVQSPLLVDKGIPPIPNLTFAQELGDLLILTKMTLQGLQIRVNLPTSSQ